MTHNRRQFPVAEKYPGQRSILEVQTWDGGASMLGYSRHGDDVKIAKWVEGPRRLVSGRLLFLFPYLVGVCSLVDDFPQY